MISAPRTSACSGNSSALEGRHDNALDGLRGLATLWVFLFHYGGGLRSHSAFLRAIGYLSQAGWIGVEIFFALSGFLITASLLRVPAQRHGLRNFLARRGLRIFPLYYAALAAACLAGLALGLRGTQWLPLLPYTVLLQNLPSLTPFSQTFAQPLTLHHLWSLAVEVQFYALSPLIVLPFARTGRPRGLAITAVAIFAALSLTRAALFLPAPMLALSIPAWAGFLPVRAGALLLGAALAAKAIRPRVSTAGAALATSVAITVAIGVRCGSLLLQGPAQMILTLPAVEIGSAALLVLVLEPGRENKLRRIAEMRPLCDLGRISYGFYIFHLLLQPLFDTLAAHLTHTASGNLYQLTRLLVALPITLGTASLSYRYFEEPILRNKRLYPIGDAARAA